MMENKIIIDGQEQDISDLVLTDAGIDKALKEQSAKYTNLYVKYADAKSLREGLEWEYKKIYASVYMSLKDNYLRSGLKKPSEDEMGMRVMTHTKVVEIIDAIKKARQVELLWEALVKGYTQKNADAQELARNMRAEMRGINPSV